VTFGSRLSFHVSAASEIGAVRLAAQSLPAGSRFNADEGTFEWTPDASQTGVWDLTLSATDAAQRTTMGHARIHAGTGEPVIEHVRNAATGSTDAVCSAGSLAALEGGWLGPESRVFVNGENTPIVSASLQQVTFVCPDYRPGPA